MTDKDPKSDLNYRGIGNLSYSEVLDEIEDYKKTFLRSTFWFILDFIVLSVVGLFNYTHWQTTQSLLFGGMIGFLFSMYVFGAMLYRSHQKKFELRLGELE